MRQVATQGRTHLGGLALLVHEITEPLGLLPLRLVAELGSELFSGLLHDVPPAIDLPDFYIIHLVCVDQSILHNF